MSFIFYLFTFFLAISTFPIIRKWKGIHKRYLILDKFNALKGKKFTFESNKDFKVAWYVIIYFSIVLFSFIGLLTSNWILFLFILIILSTSSFISNTIKVNKIKTYILGFSFTISSIILLFIPINYFHLGIDVLKEIKNYLY